MPDGTIILQAVSTIFYAQLDEELFFIGLSKIPCIEKYYGVVETLYIEINTNIADDEDVDSLIGLFYRYHVDLKQLAGIIKIVHRDLKSLERMFWYNTIFADT